MSSHLHQVLRCLHLLCVASQKHRLLCPARTNAVSCNAQAPQHCAAAASPCPTPPSLFAGRPGQVCAQVHPQQLEVGVTSALCAVLHGCHKVRAVGLDALVQLLPGAMAALVTNRPGRTCVGKVESARKVVSCFWLQLCCRNSNSSLAAPHAPAAVCCLATPQHIEGRPKHEVLKHVERHLQWPCLHWSGIQSAVHK